MSFALRFLVQCRPAIKARLLIRFDLPPVHPPPTDDRGRLVRALSRQLPPWLVRDVAGHYD